jgi:hypothetical protein
MEPRNGRQAPARARQEIEGSGTEEIDVNRAEEIDVDRAEEKGFGEETMRCAAD